MNYAITCYNGPFARLFSRAAKICQIYIFATKVENIRFSIKFKLWTIKISFEKRRLGR